MPSSASAIEPDWETTETRPGRKMGHVTRLYPLGGLPDEGAIGLAFTPAFG